MNFGIRLLGPRSPFWGCPHCEAVAQTPVNFVHRHGCRQAQLEAEITRFDIELQLTRWPNGEWAAIDNASYDGAPDSKHMMGYGNDAFEAAADLVRLFQEREQCQQEENHDPESRPE